VIFLLRDRHSIFKSWSCGSHREMGFLYLQDPLLLSGAMAPAEVTSVHQPQCPGQQLSWLMRLRKGEMWVDGRLLWSVPGPQSPQFQADIICPGTVWLCPRDRLRLEASSPAGGQVSTEQAAGRLINRECCSPNTQPHFPLLSHTVGDLRQAPE
jgi:hypothetical protein